MSVNYAIIEPLQSKLGGWFCRVLTEDQQTIMYETFQPSKRMAFVECALWLIEYNTLNQRPIVETPTQPPEEKKTDV